MRTGVVSAGAAHTRPIAGINLDLGRLREQLQGLVPQAKNESGVGELAIRGPHKPETAGSSPASATDSRVGVAQLAERRSPKPDAAVRIRASTPDLTGV